MYGQEPWFDRSHNVFFDWLVAGGILGLLSYLSLFAIALYLIFKVRGDLSAKERVLLLGALVTYFVHNTLVFDNLTSYLLFFMLLAFISRRTEGTNQKVEHKNMSEYQAVLEPVAVVLTLVVFWFAVYKPYVANTTLIKAIDVGRLTAKMPLPEVLATQQSYFQSALDLDSFGSQEVREQLLSFMSRLVTFNPNLGTPEAQAKYLEALQKSVAFTDKVIQEAPAGDKEDVRELSIYGAYFNAKKDFANAETYLGKAHTLSPKKQLITFDLISAYIGQKKYAEAYNVALENYLYRPQVTNSAIILGAMSAYVGKEEATAKLFAENGQKFPLSIEIINAYLNTGNIQRAIDLLNQYKLQNPQDAAQVDAYIKQIVERVAK
jgi:Flp pilus assembly protein TadD